VKLTLKNFQCWQSLEVELAPGITCITGKSDLGKSAILRALRWLASNRPQGDSMIRQGASFCRVTLEIDGHVIVRHRGEKGNYYLIDGKKFNFDSAKRTTPPEEVAQILNLDESLNFQLQHQSHFWLSLPPGEVSRQLNRIVALDLIDSTLSNSSQEVRRAKSEAEVSESRLQSAREQVEALLWVEEADRELEVIEECTEAVAQEEAQEALLGTLIQDWETLACRQEMLSEALTDAQELLSLWQEEQALQEELDTLDSLISEWQELQSAGAKITEKLESIQRELVSLIGDTCPLCGATMES
jgi:DNA repair protein SbcC/Rad50